jgi:hypothetical protein
MKLRRSFYDRREIIRGQQCTGGAFPGGRGLLERWRRCSCPRRSRRGPCQRFARNCATPSLTSPHDPTLTAPLTSVVVWVREGPARGRELPAHQWHASGQGFTYPQLNSRSTALSGLDRESPASGSRSAPICSEGRSSVRYGGAGQHGWRRRPVDPGAHRTAAGGSVRQGPSIRLAS